MILTVGNKCHSIIVDDDFSVPDGWTLRVDGKGYAELYISNKAGVFKSMRLHRYITNAVDGMEVDHINNNPLDNRKTNLRPATRNENGMNRRKQSNNTSGFKGVSYSERLKKWQVHICINQKTTYLGLFNCPTSGWFAYCKAAKKLHGDYCKV